MGWSPIVLPSLADSAQRLLELDEEGRGDPRLLTLFAQQDPVLMGRLLAMANSAAMLPPGAKAVSTTEGAIRVLGVMSTYATMLGAAMEGTLLAKLEFAEVRRALVKNSFTQWSTARNLARFLGLSGDDAFVLQLAALLEPLGIYAALLHPGGVSDKVRAVIESSIKEGGAAGSQSWALSDYASVSAQICEAWGAPPRVVAAVAEPTSDDGGLVRATLQLIRTRVAGMSQTESLVTSLEGHSRWSALKTTMEIDLVQFA